MTILFWILVTYALAFVFLAITGVGANHPPVPIETHRPFEVPVSSRFGATSDVADKDDVAV